MNSHPHVLLIGPAGPEGRALHDRLAAIGCRITDAAPSAPLASQGAVVVLDARRDEDGAWDALTGPLFDDPRPLIVVADVPRRLVRAIAGRRAGVMVLTGAESDGGYRIALNVCGALRPPSRSATRRVPPPALWRGPSAVTP